MEKVIRQVKMEPRRVKLQRVAAYARVSSGKEAMLHSLSEQISYYSDHIQSHPGWEYAGVYTDADYTGTKDSRPEFQRLLADCRAGKIDRVLTRYCQELCANTTASLMKLVRRRPNRPRACSAWLPASGPPVVRQGWRSHLRSP